MKRIPTITESVSTKKINTGDHQVHWKGEPTHYNIINGSINAKGKGDNTYGIEDTKKQTVHWIGSLGKAKKTVGIMLAKLEKDSQMKETYETGRRADDLESEMDKLPVENGFTKKVMKKKVSEDQIDEVSKKTMSSYMMKASDKNVKDTVDLFKKGKNMSNNEYSDADAKLKRRDSAIRKVISKLNKNVNESSHDPREYDFEGEMTKRDLETIAMHIQRIESLIDDETNMPEWVQGKITLAKDYIQTVSDYLASDLQKEDFRGEKSAVIKAIRTLHKKSRNPGYTDDERNEFRKNIETEKNRLKTHYQNESDYLSSDIQMKNVPKVSESKLVTDRETGKK